ncbi:MAG: outer membrane beta-barrel protein [Flavobacterium sp.]|nr:outer membrane beta-barrel protein [Flavobacterium sp.]
MKKIILSAVAIFTFGVASAQDKKDGSFGFAKGDIYLGGRISYNSSTDDDGTNSVKTTSTTLAPEVGYFISDNFALTLGLNSTTSDNGATEVKNSAFEVNVGGRYYFLNMGERFKTFTNFGIGFGSNDNGGGDAEKTSTLGIGGGLGINYFVTPRLAIDFGLTNLLRYSSAKTGDVSNSSIDLSINEYNNFFAAASFGLIYKL